MVHHYVEFEMADIFCCGENTKIENHMASTAIYVSIKKYFLFDEPITQMHNTTWSCYWRNLKAIQIMWLWFIEIAFLITMINSQCSEVSE